MKKPWLSVLLSFLLPGLGHMYANNVKKGMLIFLFIVMLVLISAKYQAASILGLLIYLYALFDSYKEAINANN